MHTFTLPSSIEIDLVEMTGVEEDLLTNQRLIGLCLFSARTPAQRTAHVPELDRLVLTSRWLEPGTRQEHPGQRHKHRIEAG